MTAKTDTSPALTVSEVRCEVRIEASPAKVWETLVGDVSPWWHAAYYTNPLGPKQGGYHIEPELGGRMYEDWGAGQGLIWGTVIGLETERFLQIFGDSSAEWGGPSRNCLTLRLEPDGAATQLTFVGSGFGRISEQTSASLDAGWQFLLEACLKRFIETGEIAGLDEAPSC